MSILSTILLICAEISSLLVLVGYYLYLPWMYLTFLVVHLLSLVSFVILSLKNKNKTAKQLPSLELEKLSAKLTLAEEKERELTKKVEDLTDINNRLLRQQKELPPVLPVESFHEASKLNADAGAKTGAEAFESFEALEDSLKAGPTMSAGTPQETVPYVDPLLPPIPESESGMETIDLIQIVEETMEELQSFANSVGLVMKISAADRPLYLNASALRIRILFRNIIDNSIKYMRRSGSLIITLSIIGDDIFIVLKDNGKGLSPEETPHIFQLNYQGSNRISGNGLGLTQAKAIVESYGGTIYAKSIPDQGMGIYIQIPLK